MRKLVLLVMCITMAASQLWAQTRTITGKVTDDKGAPLSGATVSVPNSNIRTATAADGSFSINVPATARLLTVSYVGFADFSAPITPSHFCAGCNTLPASSAACGLFQVCCTDAIYCVLVTPSPPVTFSLDVTFCRQSPLSTRWRGAGGEDVTPSPI